VNCTILAIYSTKIICKGFIWEVYFVGFTSGEEEFEEPGVQWKVLGEQMKTLIAVTLLL
jgi:hypothetical protein